MVIALCSFKLLMFSWNICLTLFSSVYPTSCNMSFIFVMFISLFFFYCPNCYYSLSNEFCSFIRSYLISLISSLSFIFSRVCIFSNLFESIGEYLSDIFCLFASEVILLLLWILNVYFVIIFLPSKAQVTSICLTSNPKLHWSRT